MNKSVGRNQPCPCGSGKKFKKCCLARAGQSPARTMGHFRDEKSPSSEGKYRFEPGSYGGPGGHFLPSILCLKRVGSDDWETHFVLANAESVLRDEDDASDLAAQHLNLAFAEKTSTRSDEAMAMKLRSLGYKKVDNYQLASFTRPREEHLRSDAIEGMEMGMHSDEEDLERGHRVGAAIREAVDEQLRRNDPTETRRSLIRMTNLGHSESEAKELIATILSAEIFHVLQEQREFDKEGYEVALRSLPELPEELQ